jgi:hypothetical protein
MESKTVMYEIPEIMNETKAVAAVKTQCACKVHIVPDSVSPAFPYATSSAYEGDE